MLVNHYNWKRMILISIRFLFPFNFVIFCFPLFNSLNVFIFFFKKYVPICTKWTYLKTAKLINNKVFSIGTAFADPCQFDCILTAFGFSFKYIFKFLNKQFNCLKITFWNSHLEYWNQFPYKYMYIKCQLVYVSEQGRLH